MSHAQFIMTVRFWWQKAKQNVWAPYIKGDIEALEKVQKKLQKFYRH